MSFFRILYKGLISPYILIKNYVDNSIKDVNVYKYTAINSDNTKESDCLCINENIINNFLIMENKKLLSIKTNKFIKYKYRNLNKKEISNKELVYFLVHLNKYLLVGNSLISSISLVIKKCKYKNLEKILRMVRYDLMCGNSLSTALKMQGNSFPKLLINVISDKNSNEINILKEMEEYYKTLFINKINNTKLTIYKVFIIPYILMVLMFVLGYIIPKFYNLYKIYLDEDLKIFKNFIKFSKYDNIIFLLFIFLVIIFFTIKLLQNIQKIKIFLQQISMKLFKNTINNEMVIFSKTLGIIIKYNVRESNVLNNITDNNYYNDLILNSYNYYKNEHVLSPYLKNKDFFPNKAIDMLVSGEKFDSMLLQINNISNYYQTLLDKNKKITMSIIGPFIIVFSTLLFGSIIIIMLLQFLIIIK